MSKVERIRLNKYVEVPLETNSISSRVTVRLQPGAEGFLIYSTIESDLPTAKFDVDLEKSRISVSTTSLPSSAYTVLEEVAPAVEEPTATVEEPKIEGPQPKEDKHMEPYRLSFFAIKKGMHRPATNMFQLVASKLAETTGEPWQLNTDGIFGPGTDDVAEAIQKYYKLTPVDRWIGKGSWRAMTANLPEDWRAPLRLRIAECQCTFESGKKGYGYYGAIFREGWFNFGIWNCNRGSAKRMLKLGGAPNHLIKVIDQADAAYRAYKEADKSGQAEEKVKQLKTTAYNIASEVGEWYGSKAGREAQVGVYFLRETLKPSIKNLVNVGFDIKNFGIDNLDDLDSVDKIPNQLDPFYERLLTLSCDITINSGPGGFQPKKTPRAWGGHGDEAWPEDRLPDKESVKHIYSEVWGKEIPDDYTFFYSSTRDTYRQALKRCLWELCETDEQRIELIAELQSRCIVSTWRSMVIKRRRCVARKEGGSFQLSYYCLSEHFGLGV